MKNKILLVYTPRPFRDYSDKDDFYEVPLGLLSIASTLKGNGFDIEIIDGNLDKNYQEKVGQASQDALFVGLSVMTTQIKEALEVSKLVRRVNSNTPIVWGGVHPSLVPIQTCENPYVDIVVYGQGEMTTLDLAKKLQSKEQLSNVQGIYYKKNNKVFRNQVRQPTELDDIPPLNLGLIDLQDYLKINYTLWKNSLRFSRHSLRKGDEVINRFPLYTGRGCPYNCAFCTIPIVYGPKGDYGKKVYMKKSAKKILDEMEHLIKEKNIQLILFQDELFFNDRKTIEDFLDELEARELKIKWTVLVRASFFTNCYKPGNLIERIRKNGCIALLMGAESGSNKTLRAMKKDLTREQLLTTTKLLAKHKTYFSYSFIVGFPGENKKDLLATLDIMKEMKKIAGRYVDVCLPHIFMLFPRSDLWSICEKYGYKEPGSLQEWAGRAIDDTLSTDFRKLPWIPKSNYSLIRFLMLDGASAIPNGKLLKWIYNQIYQVRRKTRYFGFPIEIFAWKYYGKLKLRLFGH